MTKDEALKMAIDFMKTLTIDVGIKTWNEKHRKEAIQACKEALEQPAQEPVAWMNDIAFSMDKDELTADKFGDIVPLYTHPAPSWQGLSDDEIMNIARESYMSRDGGDIKFARAIEAKLKEKNYG